MSKSLVENNADEIKILTPPKVQVTLKKTEKEAKEAYEAITVFVEDMISKDGKFDVESSLLLTKLVKEVVEMANAYKNLKGNQKKELVMTLVRDIFDKELENADILEDIKNLIKMVVSNSIEPAIDLAIFVANGGIKVDKKKTKKILRSICPCLSIN
jgi:hypothetical protein